MFARCCPTVRKRSQPFATARNRPCDCHMAVPIGSFPGMVIFGRFTRRVASFRVAGVALRDMWTCPVTCGKSFFVAGAILLRRFRNMRCIYRGRHSTLDVYTSIFRGRRSTLDVSDSIFRGRRSTSDVSCCVFFADRIGTAVPSGDRVQIAWQAWHFG